MTEKPARTTRHACRVCGHRHARFQYRGVVKWDRFHELCFRCYRSIVDAERARRLTGAAGFGGPLASVPGRGGVSLEQTLS